MALDPRLLPTLAIALSTKRGEDMISKCYWEAKEIERRTGHTPYERTQKVRVPEGDLPNLRLDASKVICLCDIHRAGTKSRLFQLEREVERDQDRGRKAVQQAAGQVASREIREFIAYLASKNEELLNLVHLVQGMAGTQLAVIDQERNVAISNATRRDSSVMRVISVASKRDSSAMKILAIITMAFLPGTFLGVRL
ncbi:hypothetical protein TruAng_002896 [Truncatella angustata]|nr:hypothetical protein TruAng_002896 [Truncatella angustata]